MPIKKTCMNCGTSGCDHKDAMKCSNGKCLWTPSEAEVAAQDPGCTRSHPHENMDAACEAKTIQARADFFAAQVEYKESLLQHWHKGVEAAQEPGADEMTTQFIKATLGPQAGQEPVAIPAGEEYANTYRMAVTKDWLAGWNECKELIDAFSAPVAFQNNDPTPDELDAAHHEIELLQANVVDLEKSLGDACRAFDAICTLNGIDALKASMKAEQQEILSGFISSAEQQADRYIATITEQAALIETCEKALNLICVSVCYTNEKSFGTRMGDINEVAKEVLATIAAQKGGAE